MLWIVLFVLIVLISAFLAWRSMKGYQELPEESLTHGLFLIKNLEALTGESIARLHSFALNNNLILSLEKLFKGKDSAIVIFGPANLSENFQELGLVELEDYLLTAKDSKTPVFEEKKVNLNDSFPWTIQPKNNSKKDLTIKTGFLKSEDLEVNQRFFWQIVLSPIRGTPTNFQSTVRAIVVDPSPISRVEFAKKIDNQIQNFTGLSKKTTEVQSSAGIFESFRQRTLIPKEISPFVLSGEELMNLLGLKN